MKILVLGVTGMLGSAVFRTFQGSGHDVWGTLRKAQGLKYYSIEAQSHLIQDVDVLDQEVLFALIERIKPDVVINCIGLIKQLACANDPLVILPINSLFPHQLSNMCAFFEARLIHISTDCVFSGKKGFYSEVDLSDAEDLYGKSKFIGEISDKPHAITLRTSIIGHELNSHYALVNWFLSQKKQVKGYVNAVFSGLPAIELARVMRDYVIPNDHLFGLYHVASNPINKHDLLSLIADVYQKKIEIVPDESLVLDRSLNAERFEAATDYKAPSWAELVKKMRQFREMHEGKLNHALQYENQQEKQDA